MKLFKFLLLIPLICFSKTKTIGEFSFETRFFDGDSLTKNANSSNQLLRTKFFHRYKNDSLKFYAEILGISDLKDENRNYVRPLELWTGYDDGSNIIKLGYQIFNWSATEAFHPADIINSQDFDSNFKQISKFGELALSYKKIWSQSSFEVFYLPQFEKPNFAQSTSAFGVGIDFTEPQVIKKFNQLDVETYDDFWIPQGGLRFSTNLFDSDLSLFYVNHIDRTQNLLLLNSLTNATPYYYRTENMGFTSQTAFASWVVKTEFVFKNVDSVSKTNPLLTNSTYEDHSILAIGLEKTQDIQNGASLVYLLEWQRFIGIDDKNLNYILFQNDFLVGARYAFNDAQSRELLYTIIIDANEYEQFLHNFSYRQRLGDSWIVDVGVHFVDAKSSDSYIGLNAVEESDHSFVNLTKYF
jgi:hypothetical protein